MKKMKKIGAVTIGQSPRTDVTADIVPILGDDVRIVEAGALDGLSKKRIAAFAPQKGDYVLVTRLRDGSSVQVAEKYITPLLVEKINRLFARGIRLVLLLCTGEFPGLGGEGLLVRPQRVLANAAAAVAAGRRLGVLIPAPEQVRQAAHRWARVSKTLLVLPACPYVEGLKNARAAARELKAWGAELVVMDCIGYTVEMQEAVRRITGQPVMLGRGIAARTVKELLG